MGPTEEPTPKPRIIPVPAEVGMLFDQMETLLSDLAARLNEETEKEGKLLELMQAWLDAANNESLPYSTRATYLDCAESVQRIYGGKELCSDANAGNTKPKWNCGWK